MGRRDGPLTDQMTSEILSIGFFWGSGGGGCRKQRGRRQRRTMGGGGNRDGGRGMEYGNYVVVPNLSYHAAPAVSYLASAGDESPKSGGGGGLCRRWRQAR